MLMDVVNGDASMEEFLAQLTNGQLIDCLLYTSRFEGTGIELLHTGHDA